MSETTGSGAAHVAHQHSVREVIRWGRFIGITVALWILLGTIFAMSGWVILGVLDTFFFDAANIRSSAQLNPVAALEGISTFWGTLGAIGGILIALFCAVTAAYVNSVEEEIIE